MAEFVTLNDLTLDGPAAADNPESESGPSGTNGATVPPRESAGPDVTARISELEQLVTRHSQQLNGSRQENERLRSELQALRTAPPAPAPSPQATAAPAPVRVALKDAMAKYVLENDDSLLHAYEAQMAQQTSLTPDIVANVIKKTTDDLRAELTSQNRAQTTTTTLQQALVSRHPELADIQHHADFATAAATRYQQLLQDPVTALAFPPDPAAIYRDPATGTEYDMRLLITAADYVKASRPAPVVKPPASLGSSVPGGSPPAGPVVPKSYVVGSNAVLQDPDIQKALAQNGWGNSPKEQLQNFLKRVPETTKEHWKNGRV